MSITFTDKPIPVRTDLGEGYILYVKDNQMWENDEFAVVLEETGNIRHFNTTQITVIKNDTYGIKNNQ